MNTKPLAVCLANNPLVSSKGRLGKPFFFFKQSKYGHSPEGGGVQPSPKCFGALFLGALYLGKMPKGGGKAIAKIFGALQKIFLVRLLSRSL